MQTVERPSRWVGLLGAIALCTVGMPAPGLALDEQDATAEQAAGHVVEPAQAPSIGAVLREVAGARTVLLKAGRYGVHVAPALAPGTVGLSATLVSAGP